MKPLNNIRNWQMSKLANFLICLLMLSAACTKDSPTDTPEKPGKEKENPKKPGEPTNPDDPKNPGTEPKAQTFVFDSHEKAIIATEYETKSNDNFAVTLFLSSDQSEKIVFEGNSKVHFGKTIELFRRENNLPTGQTHLKITYYQDNKQLFSSNYHPSSSGSIFISGTLEFKGALDRQTTVLLKDGKVKDFNGTQHTLVGNYSGQLTPKGGTTPNPNPDPQPQTQAVTFDGTPWTIQRAEYEDTENGNYKLYLYSSQSNVPKVQINFNRYKHTAKTIPLNEKGTSYEAKSVQWEVNYWKNSTQLIQTWGHPGYRDIKVFETGTLYINGSIDSNLTVELKDGKVQGTDGRSHTLVINYKGTPKKISNPNKNALVYNGKTLKVTKAQWTDKVLPMMVFELEDRTAFAISLVYPQGFNTLIDLTKRKIFQDNTPFFSIPYLKSDGTEIFTVTNSFVSEGPLCISGVLKTTGDPKKGGVKCYILSAGVIDKNNKQHLFEFNYDGTFEILN